MTLKEFAERAFGRKGERNTTQFRAYIGLNIIAWVIIFVWPILQGMSDGSTLAEITGGHFATYIGLPVMFVVLFYVDYYFLFDKLPCVMLFDSMVLSMAYAQHVWSRP